MSNERKGLARQNVEEAVDKLRRGERPLAGPCPPPDCSSCNGGNKGHHVLCQKRKQDLPSSEMKLRSRRKVMDASSAAARLAQRAFRNKWLPQGWERVPERDVVLSVGVGQ